MNNSTIKVVLSILAMLAFISSSACTSYSSYERIHLSPETVQHYIKPGDMVKVTKIDGSALEFVASTITSKSISGNDDEPIYFSDIEMIEKRYKDKKSYSHTGGFHLLLLQLGGGGDTIPILIEYYSINKKQLCSDPIYFNLKKSLSNWQR